MFLFFGIGKKTSPCFMCVPTHRQLFQPLCSCLTHRGCGCHCLLSLHLFRPCALLFPYQFYFKASLHRYPRIKVCLPHTSHPLGGSFCPVGATDPSPKYRGPSLWDGAAEEPRSRAAPEELARFLHSPQLPSLSEALSPVSPF